MNTYHRLLGDVALPDGRMLNRDLVREGFYWWYRNYASGNTVLEQLEVEAPEGKRGLWQDAHRGNGGSAGTALDEAVA